MTDRPDLAALRALAEDVQRGYVIDRSWNGAVQDFREACSPERILALIAEVEEARRR